MFTFSRREWHVGFGSRGATVTWVSAAAGAHGFILLRLRAQRAFHLLVSRRNCSNSARKLSVGPIEPSLIMGVAV
jgi:hypothetical protein